MSETRLAHNIKQQRCWVRAAQVPHMHTKWYMRVWALDPIHLGSLCISCQPDSRPRIARFLIKSVGSIILVLHVSTMEIIGYWLSIAYVLHACSCFSSTGGFIIVYLRTSLYCTSTWTMNLDVLLGKPGPEHGCSGLDFFCPPPPIFWSWMDSQRNNDSWLQHEMSKTASFNVRTDSAAPTRQCYNH